MSTQIPESPTTQGQEANPFNGTVFEQTAPKDNGEGIKNYTDGYSYEVPRPFLTIEQAASVLGKTLRSLERSILGRWGNKLPDGWQARKIRTSAGEEWRIIPPPGFRVRQILPGTTSDTIAAYSVEQPHEELTAVAPSSGPEGERQAEPRRKPLWRPERHTLDQPTIVIERTEEVEQLLRELVSVQKALAEERRLHLEDLRLITHLQTSVRLLESHASEKEKVNNELAATKAELNQLKEQYNRLLKMPWWRRLFISTP
jgi:hypothetical protein